MFKGFELITTMIGLTHTYLLIFSRRNSQQVNLGLKARHVSGNLDVTCPSGATWLGGSLRISEASGSRGVGCTAQGRVGTEGPRVQAARRTP